MTGYENAIAGLLDESEESHKLLANQAAEITELKAEITKLTSNVNILSGRCPECGEHPSSSMDSLPAMLTCKNGHGWTDGVTR